MFRVRCREMPSTAELATLYPAPHSSKSTKILSRDHEQRIKKTLELADWFIDEGTDHKGADLSCGDATFARCFSLDWSLGDFAPGYAFHGPIEKTIHEIPDVDVFVCCETIEHLDDPDAVLVEIRKRTKKLILSTPICTWVDKNPEHIWAFDDDAVQDMLKKAGFRIVDYKRTTAQPGYIFQIYGAL